MQADLSSISFGQITAAVSRFLHRYHIILFALIVLGGLSIATFLLYSTITSTAPDNATATSNGTFDKATMEKVQNLRGVDDASQPLELTGRTNPFK